MVSVITVVKNDAAHIEETMCSVLDQQYGDLEYVIKGGRSKDATPEIVDSVIRQYPDRRIRYVDTPDGGIYDAMNQAVAICRGEWILFMNSGDLFVSPHVLADIFGKKDVQKADVLYGDAIVSAKAGQAVWKADFPSINRKMPFCHQACLIRRELLKQTPFDLQYRIAADYDNLLTLYEKGARFLYVDRLIAVFCLQGVSSTRFVLRYRETEAVRRKHGLRPKAGPGRFAGLLLAYGKEVCARIVPNSGRLWLEKIYLKHRYAAFTDGEREKSK